MEHPRVMSDVQYYGSHDDLSSPRERSTPFFREDRRFSCDVAGYLEDDDSDSDGYDITPRRKQRHKLRTRDWGETPSPDHQDSFDEMFKYFTRECDIRLENESTSHVNRPRCKSSVPGPLQKRVQMHSLKTSKDHNRSDDTGQTRGRSSESFFRQRSNTQPNISLNCTCLSPPDLKVKDGSRSPRFAKRTRSPMAACMPTSPPSSPWFSRRHHSFHSSQQDDLRRREGNNSYNNNTPEAFNERVLSHVADLVLKDTEWEVGDMRPRVASLPARHPGTRRLPSLASLRRNSGVHRVRSYVITPHGGVIKEGERYVSNSSVCSTESNLSAGTTTGSLTSLSPSPNYRIILSGQDGVGKRAIIQRFLVPHDAGTANSSLGKNLFQLYSIFIQFY